MGNFNIRFVNQSLFLLCFLLTACPVSAGSGQSQCIACHTDLKKLIRLCWEVEKIKPPPPASEENYGEG